MYFGQARFQSVLLTIAVSLLLASACCLSIYAQEPPGSAVEGSSSVADEDPVAALGSDEAEQFGDDPSGERGAPGVETLGQDGVARDDGVDAGLSEADGEDAGDVGLAARDRLDMLASEHRSDLPDGLYVLATLNSPSAVLEVAGGATVAGSALQLYGANGTDAQVWRVSHDEKGYVTISSVLSDLVLDVEAGSIEPGVSVRLWTNNGTYAQKWIAVRDEDGSLRFVSALAESISLEAMGGGTYNGTPIQSYQDNGTPAQRWSATETQTMRERMDRLAGERAGDLPDGVYVLHAMLDDDKIVEVAGGSAFDAAPTQLYAYNGTAAQRWRVTHDDLGYVTLINDGSGRALDVAGAVAGAGARVQQYAQNGSLAQKWIAVREDDGSIRFISALRDSLVIESSSTEASAGESIQLGNDDGSAVQRWRVEDFAETISKLDQLAAAHRDALSDGVYIMRASVGSRMVVEVAAGDLGAGANVQTYLSNMTKAQQWRVTHDDLGYATFTNVNSGKVLGTTLERASVGANIEQSEPSDSRAQKWVVIPEDGENLGGGCRLYSALYPGLVVEVAGAGIAAGTNVQLYSDNGTAAQVFTMISTTPSVAPCEDILPDGWFVIAPQAAQGYALDVDSGMKADGTNVQLYTRNSSQSQLFRFEFEDGYYCIISGVSGRALDVEDGNLIPPTNVQIWEPSSTGDNAKQQFTVADNGDGSYTFTNRATGLVLDIDSAAYANGSNVQAYTLNGSAAQKFVLVQQPSLMREGVMNILPVSGSYRAVEVAAASVEDDATIQAYSQNGTLAQKWLVSLVEGSDNTYTLENLASGKVLTVVDGGRVIQRAYAGDASQHWIPDIADNGSYILKNAALDLNLQIAGGSTADGARVEAAAADGSDAQRFYVNTTVPLGNGTYWIQSGSDPSMVLDVNAGSRDNGANVQLWQNNDSDAQKWSITRLGDGSYLIENARSHKMLDVLDAVAASGTNVQQWEANNSLAQRWVISYEGGGRFKIASMLNQDFVLEVAGSSMTNGANIQISADSQVESQRFTFARTTYDEDYVLDVSRDDLVSWLESHEYDGYYLGTRYSGGFSLDTCLYPNGQPRWDGFTGMNCTGFVAHAYRAVGGDVEAVGRNNNHSPWAGGPGGGSYINAWRWYGYAIDSGAEVYHFANVAQMLASGLAEKGDIIFFKTNGSIDCHIGFFWGNSSSDNRMWHQILPGNLIGPCFNNANKSEWNQQTVLIK